MNPNDFYELVRNKDKGFKEFMEFLDCMIDMRKYIESDKYEPIRENYYEHFEKVPHYARDLFEKLRHELMVDSSTIGMGKSRLDKKLDEFSKL